MSKKVSSPKHLSKNTSVADLSLPLIAPHSPTSKRESPAPCRCAHHSTDDSHEYHNLSSSVLQHPSHSACKFSTAERFPPIKDYGPKVHSHGPAPCKKPCCKNNPLYKLVSDRYNLKSDFGAGNGKGRSFGLPYQAYEKTYVPGNKEVPLHEGKLVPGPGAYQVENKNFSPKANGISFGLRGKMYNDELDLGIPASNMYSPKMAFVQPARHASPSFGYGKKFDFTQIKNLSPGPGAYSPAVLGGRAGRKELNYKV